MSAGTIDCFDDGSIAIDDLGPTTNSAGETSACAIGGARFAYIPMGPVNLGGALTTNAGGSGLLDIDGRAASLQWTGATDPSVTPGLGGIDLTDGGTADRIRRLMRCNTNCFYEVFVFSEHPGSNYLIGSRTLTNSGIGSPFVPVDVLFNELTPNGTGASVNSVSVLRFNFGFNTSPQVGEPQFQVDWIGAVGDETVPEPAMQGAAGITLIVTAWLCRKRSRRAGCS
ncbi:MAG: hypothetical protein U0R19_04010 [Bryobacteraceae bacterium]